ncbi:hypothetical protein ACFV9E_44330 [Streptomyces sp. NPDC059835]|uniref:hypothetical protein n=1 Tax=Streptomyces sp. NPDC059835 TaxID=3346967 RepID=UPI00365637A4
MPSVMGLLEERERAARQRVDALQAELREAEAAWERFVIAREAVAEVLAEPRAGEEGPPDGVAGAQPVRVVSAVPGSVVPVWREDLLVIGGAWSVATTCVGNRNRDTRPHQ